MQQAGLAWLAYAMVTVVAFGAYGNLLHAGQVGMGDPLNGRYKAFLFVGIAYFLVAVLAPVVILMANGATWDLPMKGAGWSLFAGTAGAVGAFAILLAFGAKGTPAVVMSIVFAGAPIVNAIISMIVSPPVGGMSAIRWQFVAGILLAALGGYMVTFYKPPPAPGAHASAARQSVAAAPTIGRRGTSD